MARAYFTGDGSEPENSRQDMHYEQEVFTTQFPIAKRFIYHFAFYRVLSAAYRTHGFQSEFWAPTIDAHLLQAAILWCTVFGSKGSSRVHWKRLSRVDSDRLQASFRKGLPRWTGLNWAKWETYCKDMVEFRNKYAAHRERNDYGKPVPNFDIALKVIYYYDNWVRKVISPDTFAEPLLATSFKRLTIESEPLIQQLFETTKAFSRTAGTPAGR